MKQNFEFLKSIGNRINRDLLFYLVENKSRGHLKNILPFYFPYSHYAMRYYDLEMIVNQILFSKSQQILEIGSGLSTLCFGILGKKMPEINVHVLEHDQQWLDLMSRLIEMNNIENIKLEYVPLKEFRDGQFSGNFFNLERVELGQYDAVIVDGPPANKPELIHSRYPAIHIIKNNLKKDGFFYFDDLNRRGEQECLDGWLKQISAKAGVKHKYGKGQIYLMS